MQDKLRIGVVIEENYHPEVGGGFGYYESLITAIDNYQFNTALEFVFIQFSEANTNPFMIAILYNLNLTKQFHSVVNYNRQIAT